MHLVEWEEGASHDSQSFCICFDCVPLPRIDECAIFVLYCLLHGQAWFVQLSNDVVWILLTVFDCPEDLVTKVGWLNWWLAESMLGGGSAPNLGHGIAWCDRFASSFRYDAGRNLWKFHVLERAQETRTHRRPLWRTWSSPHNCSTSFSNWEFWPWSSRSSVPAYLPPSSYWTFQGPRGSSAGRRVASFRHGEVVQEGEGPSLVEVKEKGIKEGWG